MPNIGTVLKEEISRLARKEIRREAAGVKKNSAQHRRDIAALKRRVTDLSRKVALLERKTMGEPPAPAAGAGDARVRFTAKGLRSQRKRLDLSAADYGKLVGVTAQSIYNWEREAAQPRKAQIVALAALRSVGKREAQARLRQLAGRKSRSRKR